MWGGRASGTLTGRPLVLHEEVPSERLISANEAALSASRIPMATFLFQKTFHMRPRGPAVPSLSFPALPQLGLLRR